MKSFESNSRISKLLINVKVTSNSLYPSERHINMEVYVNFKSSELTSIEIKPFHLFYNRKELHLDPIHNLLRWIRVSRLTAGPLFRRVDQFDRVVMTSSKSLVISLGIYEPNW
jgi:hypothetical protein